MRRLRRFVILEGYRAHMTKPQKKIIRVVDIVPITQSKKTKRKVEPIQEPPVESPTFISEVKFEALKDFESPSRQHEDSFSLNQEFNFSGEDDASEREGAPLRKRSKKMVWGGIIAIIIFIGVYYASGVLAKVTIHITEKKYPVSYDGSLQVIVGGTPATSTAQIPGELMSEHATSIFTFPATGTAHVEQKAQGTILIFNNYSTAPQPLVATTRFVTPDGKIFRLVNATVVPGAQKTASGLKPESIEAHVIADQPGEAYNIGPVDKFTIPGFQGSSKYKGFYGQSTSAMSGGFVGVGPVATDADITQAQDQAQKQMQDKLETSLFLKLPQDVTFVKGSEQFQVISKNVDTTVDAQKNFSVSIEEQATAMTFNEKDVRALLKTSAITAGQIPDATYQEKDSSLTYGTPNIQWNNATMSLPTSYKATFWEPINAGNLEQSLQGKDESTIKTTILEMNGIDSLSVSFWPFWVTRVPQNSSQVRMTID